MGLTGNLSVGEILEQIIHADHILASEWNTNIQQIQQQPNYDHPTVSLPKLDLVRNVVFMGMGEPLDNYDNVVASCRALTDNRRWSTCC
jgi:23S rRNA (adenine2503-C2)-methyltransferase